MARRDTRQPLSGTVRRVERRSEEPWTVLSFELEREEQAPSLVELRGLSFKGSLRDGDHIAAVGVWREDGAFEADYVHVDTTGATVTPAGNKVTLGGVLFLAVFMLMAWALPITAFVEGRPHWPMILAFSVFALLVSIWFVIALVAFSRDRLHGRHPPL